MGTINKITRHFGWADHRLTSAVNSVNNVPTCTRKLKRKRALFVKMGGQRLVPLARKKRLFLNVRRKYLLVPPFGKKSCDINERLSSLISRQAAVPAGSPRLFRWYVF